VLQLLVESGYLESDCPLLALKMFRLSLNRQFTVEIFPIVSHTFQFFSLNFLRGVIFLQWNFRIGFTPREGLVIHTVAYDDGSRGRRSVAHRLSFVEMVVPYGDPKDPHYRKNAFDAGEDGLGKNCHSLRRVSISVLPHEIN